MEASTTKAAHTPGPWAIRKISDRLYGVNDPKGIAVADLHTIQGRHTAANARLISAAPDYDAAARAMVERHDAKAKAANFDLCGCEDCCPFRPILVKATGAA